MKKLYKLLITALTLTILLSAAAIVPASAANATINGEEVPVGAVVTYVLTMGEVPDPIAGIDMRLYFDPDVLEYVDKSFVGTKNHVK